MEELKGEVDTEPPPDAGGWGRFLDALSWVPGVLVAVMSLGIAADVVLRNLGFGSMPFMLEMVEYGLYTATFVGAASMLYLGRHVRIGVFMSMLPRAPRAVAEVVGDALVLAMCVLLAVYGAFAAQTAYDTGAVLRQFFSVPEWVPLSLLPIAFGLLAIEAARQLSTSVRRVRDRSIPFEN